MERGSFCCRCHTWTKNLLAVRPFRACQGIYPRCPWVLSTWHNKGSRTLGTFIAQYSPGCTCCRWRWSSLFKCPQTTAVRVPRGTDSCRSGAPHASYPALRVANFASGRTGPQAPWSSKTESQPVTAASNELCVLSPAASQGSQFGLKASKAPLVLLLSWYNIV